ncbi:MAG: rod shape-determining protein MreD [Gammaproteobacteria bacterium]|nr:MAG: rod shape-determining protein MreD [Gammaproteobacteria bacterium]
MSNQGPTGTWVIVFSFCVAYFLALLPFPHWAEWGRPEWVALVLLYWVIALPHRVGVMTGWMVGLGVDVMEGSVLGLNALSLAVMAYLAILLHRRLRVFPAWQQALAVLVLVGLSQLMVRVISNLVGGMPSTMWYWVPSIVSAFLWPWLLVILRFIRRRFVVT